MDRGFGGSFRGGFSGNRNLSDRRYDDFYSDNNRRGGGGGRNNVNRNRGNNNAGDWVRLVNEKLEIKYFKLICFMFL